MIEDFERCYRAVSSKDGRFDGMFITAVTSTGIYCRPSCPAITPKRANVRFYATPAAAQAAGFRACKRCRPDASPGSPEWNVRADVVGRAMRAISDGVVDREGVAGLAARLHFSERHLHRLLVSELGAGPQAVARAHRAQTARVLIETTGMAFSDVAFAAGFTSIRQFNDTIRRVFASSPSELRRKSKANAEAAPGQVVLRLPYREPFAGDVLLTFLGARAVPGIEEFDGTTYRRSLRLPHSSGTVSLSLGHGHMICTLRLGDIRDLSTAVQRCRRLLDLDADPVAVDSTLAQDKLLKTSIRRRRGIRIPQTTDGTELVVRAILGQQISVAGARTLAARLVDAYGKPLTAPDGALTHVFPDPETIARADLSRIGVPTSRRAALQTVAAALAEGSISLEPEADRDEVREQLLALRGIGPWTVEYVKLRALGDPDAFPASDLGVRKALARLGAGGSVEEVTERWRPWRGYALQHLWNSLG